MDVNDLLKDYEKLLYLILTVLFGIIVTVSICELVLVVYDALVVTTPLLLENDELLSIFGYFLLVLIGIELLATVSAYINDNVIHVEIVIMIAIIAVVRGVILVDPKTINAMTMFGTAAIIFTLCSGYYFLKKAGIGIQHRYDQRQSRRSFAPPGSQRWQSLQKLLAGFRGKNQ